MQCNFSGALQIIHAIELPENLGKIGRLWVGSKAHLLCLISYVLQQP